MGPSPCPSQTLVRFRVLIGEDGAGAAAVEELLSLGLGAGGGAQGDRLTSVRAWLAPLAPWDPAAPVPPPPRTVVAGVGLDVSKALSLVDRGPVPTETDKVAEWSAMWGSASEARRFKDGAIVHAVVWDVPAASRHTVCVRAARYLLHRHLGVSPSAVTATIG